MIRVGILGLGFMGRTHFSRYASIPDATVVAVADREAERRQADFRPAGNLDLGLGSLDLQNVRVAGSAEELIQDPNVDLVDICLPTFLHSQYALMALEHGKHVISEKPLALTSAEADQVLEAALAARRRVFVAQVVRFWPEYVYLRQTVRSVELGRLLFLNMSRQTSPAAWAWDNWNADARRSGGILDIHIHDVDYCAATFGLPAEVYAQGTPDREVVMAQYSYSNGLRVGVFSSRLLSPAIGFEAWYEAVFEGGSVRYHSAQSPTLSVYRAGHKTPEHPTVEGDAYLEELRCFIELIETRKKGGDVADPIGARNSLRLFEAEMASIDAGSSIQLA